MQLLEITTYGCYIIHLTLMVDYYLIHAVAGDVKPGQARSSLAAEPQQLNEANVNRIKRLAHISLLYASNVLWATQTSWESHILHTFCGL